MTAPSSPSSPWDAIDGFQLVGPRQTHVAIDVDCATIEAVATYVSGSLVVTVDGVAAAADAHCVGGPEGAIFVLRRGRQSVVKRAVSRGGVAARRQTDGVVAAPMHGKVAAILVREGDSVTAGQRVAVVEAMKMEHVLITPCDGTVADVAVQPGAQIAEGVAILRVAPATVSDV